MSADPTASFGDYVKPLLRDYLRASGLDVTYVRARGDFVYYRDESGEEVEVLDLVGGFGASLLGHNHDEIVRAARGVLDAERPFHAQASVRAETGELGARLCSLAERATGRRFYVTFANSGAEAVEAAIKHAEMERRIRVDGVLARITAQSHSLRRRLRERSAHLPPTLLAEAARLFGVSRLRGLDELLNRLYHRASDALDVPSIFLAVEGAFHGKTTGSVQLTHRPEYQTPWTRLGPRSQFLPFDDVEAVERVLRSHDLVFFDLEIGAGGSVRLVDRTLSKIAAIFVEPIQGEGGIRELSREYMAALRDAADRCQAPLVVDEIQSGMGRTGRFFAAEHSGVRADYYLLSKALGGGLAKISATLIDGERYLPEFGFIHTSTFADDDFSAVVARATLAVVERDEGALMRRCEEVGGAFIERLRALAAEHPAQIREVRGRGLMIGVELADQSRSPSPLIRVLGDQELLGFVVSGYFLHEHRIRVVPTLSARATLRLEPSYLIAPAELRRFADALAELAEILERGDAYRLLRYLVGRAGEDVPEPSRAAVRRPEETSDGAARVAFLSHFLEAGNLRAWEPSLSPFSERDCEDFLRRTAGIIRPFVAGSAALTSPMGTSVHATIIGIPFLPEQAVEAMREGGGEWATNLIAQGVELGRQLGCSVVGFGGYTSILTNNCRAVEASDVALTSGNSLTAAAGLDAMFLAAERRGIGRRVLGVVGAVGNIGRVLADVAADDVDEIVLIGSGRGKKRLERAARELCWRVYRRLRSGEPPRSGLERSIAESGVWRRWRTLADGEESELTKRLWASLAELDGSPLRVATELAAARQCNLIITATNAPRPIITPEHVREDGPVVVCDVAVPLDVDPRVVAERPNATVLRGGLVKAPMSQDVQVDGMSLRPGEIYGCLGETLLMGLAGIGEDYSYGPLDALKVRRIREIARMHGFTIEDNPLVPAR